MGIEFNNKKTKCSLKITQIVILFVFFLYISWIGAWFLEKILEQYTSWMNTSQSGFFYWLFMKIIIWVLPAFLIIKHSGEDLYDIFGIKRLRSILIWGGGVGLILVILTIISKLAADQPFASFELSWTFLGGVIVSPIVEEITFRGAILGGLKKQYSFIYANLLTSIFFLGIHLPGWYFQNVLIENLTAPIGGAISIFILGFVFGYVVHKSKSVSAGILTHFLNNLSNFLF